ncbi:MAG: SPFH domain-containing protein [Planctomycetota bacterium]
MDPKKLFSFSFLLAVIIVAALSLFMFSFTVRYDEVAVATRFERAIEPQRDADGQLPRDAAGELVNSGWLYQQPGLYPRFPWPINNVYKYSKQLQTLEHDLSQVQLSDGQQVVVQLFTVWRIDDPYAFFRTLRTNEQAVERLRAIVQGQAIRSVISRFAFSDFVNADEEALQLQDIEQAMAIGVRAELENVPSSYGIAIDSVGIRQLVLPEQTTTTVFERMRSTQEKLAEAARAEGEARAATIRSEAETDRQRILAFANRRAQAIRTEGDLEAASFANVFAENEELAVFLRRVDALREMLPNNTTFILSAEDIGLKDVLSPIAQEPPTAVAGPVGPNDTSSDD